MCGVVRNLRGNRAGRPARLSCYHIYRRRQSGYLAHPFVQLVTWSFTHTYVLGHIGLNHGRRKKIFSSSGVTYLTLLCVSTANCCKIPSLSRGLFLLGV